MRKGFTLVEILISMTIATIMLATVTLTFKTNAINFKTATDEIGSYGNLRNIESLVLKNIKDSEYLEILETMPESFEEGYNYLYSLDGDVFFVDGEGSKIKLNNSEVEKFKTIFTKTDDSLLNIEIDAINSGDNKKTDVYLANLIDGTTIVAESVLSSNIIMYMSNAPIENIEEASVISFSFKKSENTSNGSWPSSEYVGVIDEENLTITVDVDYEVNASFLIPNIEYSGVSLLLNNTLYEKYVTEINFSNIVNLDVINEIGQIKTYKVIVSVKGEPRINFFEFRKADNSQLIIDERIGYINQSTNEIYVSVPENNIIDHLKPYFEISGDYVEVNGTRLLQNQTMDIDFSEPIVFKVYAKMADGTSYKSKIYTIYVDNQPYLFDFSYKGSLSSTIYNSYVDETSKQILLPSSTWGTGTYNFKYSGEKVTMSGKYLVGSSSYSYDLSGFESLGESIFSKTITFSSLFGIPHVSNSGKVTVQKDGNSKNYTIVKSGTGIFDFFYENTGDTNEYLFEDKVKATIDQTSKSISLVFPQNEYLEEMTAYFSYAGEKVITNNNKSDNQISGKTITNIDNNKITSYGAKGRALFGLYDYYTNYSFKISESEAPKLTLTSSKLTSSGPKEKIVLTAPTYNYEKGINRNEIEDGATYTWYFVSSENLEKFKTDTSLGTIMKASNENTLAVEDFRDYIVEDGYFICSIQTKSEEYTVESKPDVTYGGVLTNVEYTETYAVDSVNEINLEYVMWSDGNLSTTGGNINPQGNLKPSIYVGGDATIGTNLNSVIIDIVGKLTRTGTSNNVTVNEGIETKEMPDFATKFDDQINSTGVVKEQSIVIDKDTKSDGLWLYGNKVTFQKDSPNSNPLMIKMDDIDSITGNNTYTMFGNFNFSDLCIIYYTGTKEFSIWGNIEMKKGFIYAPNAKVLIGGNGNITGGIYAKEIKIDGNVQFSPAGVISLD